MSASEKIEPGTEQRSLPGRAAQAAQEGRQAVVRGVKALRERTDAWPHFSPDSKSPPTPPSWNPRPPPNRTFWTQPGQFQPVRLLRTRPFRAMGGGVAAKPPKST